MGMAEGGTMGDLSPLEMVGFLWSAVTFALVGFVIYRAVVGIHEENQIFIGRAEAALEKEQGLTLKRIHAIDVYVKSLAIASGLLLLIIAGIWFYNGMYGAPA
jgi:hypothetical protein